MKHLFILALLCAASEMLTMDTQPISELRKRDKLQETQMDYASKDTEEEDGSILPLPGTINNPHQSPAGTEIKRLQACGLFLSCLLATIKCCCLPN